MAIPGSAGPFLLAQLEEEGGYEIERSLRFNSSDSAYLSRTPASAGNRKTWTWAGWVKKVKNESVLPLLNARQSYNDFLNIWFDSNDGLYINSRAFGSNGFLAYTAAVFRDPSAWYHVLIAIDTTQASGSNGVKAYVNGTQQALTIPTYNQNADTYVNSTHEHRIGYLINQNSSTYYLDSYLADAYLIDGQQLTPSAFGEFDANGVWQPKAYDGSYGTNGFHLPFSDNSTAAALGTDTSGNGNDWTVNNISVSTGVPTSVAEATGAIPVLNTTDTYGNTLGTGVRSDAYASSVVLAVPAGTNLGLSLTDEAPAGRTSSIKTVTNVNVTSNTSVSKFYGGSAYFNGNARLQYGTSTDFQFNSSSNFTVECYVNFSNAASTQETLVAYYYYQYGGVEQGWSIQRLSNGTIRFMNSSFGNQVVSTTTISAGSWTHIACVITAGVGKMYIDGIAEPTSAAMGTPGYGGAILSIGSQNTSNYLGWISRLSGYIQDVRIYNGVAKYATNFNPPSATLNPTVAAGNDSLADSPTNGSQEDTGVGGEVVGNYCTWNPLDKSVNTTLANGNLDCTWAAASGGMKGTIGISSGKWYWEITVGANASVGLIKSSVGQANSWPGDSVYGSGGSYGYAPNGQKVTNSSYSAYGTAHTNGDVVGVAYDADNGKLFFSRNGTWQASGDPAAGTNAAFTSITGEFSSGLGYWTTPTTNVNSVNFGQRQWAYAAPAGFKALCTANLPEPTIADGSTAMDVALYTGNGSTQTISGLNFSPDLVWIKNRGVAHNHAIYDVQRGAYVQMQTNLTAEDQNFNPYGVTAFNSDGFGLNDLSNGGYNVNGSSMSYVAWTWDAGSSTVTNTQGSITSQVRANASAGFSVVTYTGNGTAGATIGHGLGVNPSFVIVKSRSGSGSSYYWTCYHGSLGATKALELNSTTAAFISPGAWNNTEPTSSVFSVASNAVNNGSGSTYVAYCFAPVSGYSSFGSYTGNGSADGPFVYTGFRPRWLLVKASSAGESYPSWRLFDTARDTYNVAGLELYPNLSSGEGDARSSTPVDILSNGFKLRANATWNTSGVTYVYMTFAENPFKYARAR